MNEAGADVAVLTRNESPQKPVPTAEKAAFFFEKVSNKFPASGFAQAARISQLCRQSDYDPLELRDKLWDDKAQRKSLIDKGVEAHERAIARAKERGVPEEQLPKPPGREFVKALILRNIVYEFTLASQMKDLPDEQIAWILDQYESYRGKEDEYGDMVADRMKVLTGVTALMPKEAEAMITQHRVEGVKNWARSLHKPRGRHAARDNQEILTKYPISQN